MTLTATPPALTYTPGTNAAVLLFRRGLRFEAVVRGLMTELRFNAGQATSAAAAAVVELLDGPPALHR
jgi:hypothetical protein